MAEGDARLSMEQQTPQNYDVIALDAFSGDAIPAHLLTVEACRLSETSQTRRRAGGAYEQPASGSVPIVALLAAHYQMQVVSVDADDGGGVADSSSEWLLVTNNQTIFELGRCCGGSCSRRTAGPGNPCLDRPVQ